MVWWKNVVRPAMNSNRIIPSKRHTGGIYTEKQVRSFCEERIPRLTSKLSNLLVCEGFNRAVCSNQFSKIRFTKRLYFTTVAILCVED